MMSGNLKLHDHFRIISALVQKDVLNAIKNRSILISLITVILVVVLYRFLPALEQGDILPTIAVYDQSGSQLVSELIELEDIHVFEADSVDQMKRYLANRDYVSLGVILPADFDALRAEEDEIFLDGYFIYWAEEDEARVVQSKFEKMLSELSQAKISINSKGNAAYPTQNSTGLFFLASVSMIICFSLVSFSVAPYLMLDEKGARTLDVLLVSPARAIHIILGKALTALFYCMLGAILLIAIYLPLFNQWWLALLCFFLCAFLLVTLGLILGMLVQSKQHMMIWMWVAFPLVVFPPFLSIARDLFPPLLIQFLRFTPTVALTRLLRISFADASPLSLLIPELSVVLGFIILSTAVVIVLFNRHEAR